MNRHLRENNDNANVVGTPPAANATVATDTTGALIARAKQLARRRNLVVAASLVAVCAWTFTALGILSWMSTHRPPFPIGWLGFEIPAIELVPVALVVLLVGRHSLRLTRAERDVATRLAQCNDPRAISALVEALSVPDRRVQRPLVAAVTSILSWVTPDDEPLFTERNRRFMVGVLGHVEDGLGGRYYGEQYHLLVLATLHAVAQIGDQRAVDSVRHLAYLDAQNAHQEEVRKVARTCLPLVEARVAAQRVGAGLLLAADQPAADALLRAASSSIEPDGALLRPAPSPTHECLNSDLSD